MKVLTWLKGEKSAPGTLANDIRSLTVLELINNATSLSGMETSSAVLPDLNRQAADVFGLFGRIVMIEDFMTITYDGTIDFDGKYNFAY
jgi:hypothetical protein